MEMALFVHDLPIKNDGPQLSLKLPEGYQQKKTYVSMVIHLHLPGR